MYPCTFVACKFIILSISFFVSSWLLNDKYRLLALVVIGSGEGISPSPSHGTVRESLDSYGSSCLVTKVVNLHGCTTAQWGKSAGFCRYLPRSHLTALSV